VDDASNCFEFYAGLATKIHGENHAGTFEFIQLRGTRTDWRMRSNHTMELSAPYVHLETGTCPAAGNCCILKPAELTPLTALKLAELIHECGFPLAL
jgi:betaine-aldehyde dehydrogenase